MPKRVKELRKKDRDAILNRLRVKRNYYENRAALIKDGHEPHHGLSLRELKANLVQINKEIASLTSKGNSNLSKIASLTRKSKGRLSKNEKRDIALNRLRVRRCYYTDRIAQLEERHEPSHGLSLTKLKRNLRLVNRQLTGLTTEEKMLGRPAQKLVVV